LSLLSIEHATKRYRRGRLERVAVRDVSLQLEPGELVAVWGARFSGRSTLLRLAAGIELPEEGRVLFEGLDLAHSRNRVLGRRIAYWHASLAAAHHGLAIDQVASGLLAQRVLPRQARRRAQELLFRAGVEHCEHLQCHELAGAEIVRVAIAGALATMPALLVIDEPTSGVDLLERDPLLSLLRAIANEGTAVLVSTGDAQGLSGVDRALSMDGGELRGEVRSSDADVVQLRRAESGVQRR
jgi:energy-coupling factor transporter ATP-binding protein EcfA2